MCDMLKLIFEFLNLTQIFMRIIKSFAYKKKNEYYYSGINPIEFRGHSLAYA